MKLNDGLGRFVITVLICLVVIATSAVFINTRPQPKKNTIPSPVTSRINYIKAGWKHYINDTLGIEFQYPQQWGEVKLGPTENITNLQTVNKDFLEDEDNDYRYMVEIGFSQNDDINLHFINNYFQGSKYPNGYAYLYGPANNFIQLKNTGNICDYHLLFDHRPQYPDIVEEQYNVCENHVKTTLTKDSHFDSGYHNYKVSQFYFKKINNGFFDNLLIENYITSTGDENGNLIYEDLINKNNSQNNHQQNMTLFKEFVKTIGVFTPPRPTPITFSVKSGEDSNIATIRQYYFYLATQKLEAAYAMYQNQNISFIEFTSWYDQVFNTKIGNIKQINLNTYEFDVDILEQNQPVSKYRVIMEVKNGKINTLSSEQITSDEVKFNNLTAYTRTKLHKNEVVLFKNGQEIVIDSADNDFEKKMGTTAFFSDPKFSSFGNYLTYSVGVWEAGYSKIYDIKNNKFINDPEGFTSSLYQISANEKSLVNCGFSRFDGTERAMIYSFPDLSPQYDFLKEFHFVDNRECLDKEGNPVNIDCDVFSCKLIDNNIVEFSIKSSEDVRKEDQKNLLIKYDLNTNKIIQ